MEKVRVWTDASHYIKGGAAYWGCLIQYKGKFFRYKGVFRDKSIKCHEAERLAMINGLYLASKHSNGVVEIYSDCKNEVRRFNGELKKKLKGKIGNKHYRKLLLQFRAVEIQFLPRKHNHYADYLARLARTEKYLD